MVNHCTPFTLPSNGVIAFDSTTIKLTTNVVFRPECTGVAIQDALSLAGGKEPFYASTIPQVYVIAAATVIAWILVVMLLITPRTNFWGQSGTAPGFSSGRGIIGGATGGNTNLIGVGSRPWLQKVAAGTAAISLTIATADTLVSAQRQYEAGYMDAEALRDEVLGSMEIRIMRVISYIFLWLAQVQTLIRLFPRHKEKVLIKWIGFMMILLDSIFSCLNSFMVDDTHSEPRFVDAIPALSYLFELALALLYASWVIYYSLTKHRYAFYQPKMPSISLIAMLSLVAVLTPVVFFVTDVSDPDVASWGDYFRWVGAAAASVVVWEWVERIEALERDEKKDGILGREIFDGDEMLDPNPSTQVVWERPRYERSTYKRDEDNDGGNQSSALEKGFSSVARRFRHRTQKPKHHFPLGRAHSSFTPPATESAGATTTNNGAAPRTVPRATGGNDDPILGGPTPPPPVASPVSRADAKSAASTVYVVEYDPTADIPQPVRRRADPNGNTQREIVQARKQKAQTRDPEKEEAPETDEDVRANKSRGNGAWLSVANPFKRKRASPPAEVQQARRDAAEEAAKGAGPTHNFSRWDIKNRFGVIAAETGGRFRERRDRRQEGDDIPVTIIPAQPRGSGRTRTPPADVLKPAEYSSAGASSSDNPPRHQDSGPAVVKVNSNPAPTSQQSTNPPRTYNATPPTAKTASPAITSTTSPLRASTTSPLVAGGSRSPAISIVTNRSSPPRADDIRPIAGSSTPTVIPAPRRETKSSPLAMYQISSSSSRRNTEDESG